MPRDPSTSSTAVLSPSPAPVIPSTAMVASAVSYQGTMPRIWQGVREWQRECYRHFAICGEARYAARFMGHAMSRAVLRIARVTPEGTEKLTEGPAVELLEQLFAGKDGQAQMLEALGVHLTIAGECYLVGRSTAFDPDDPEQALAGGQQDIWEIVSVIEMRVIGRQWSIHHEGYHPIELTDADVAIRIWIPDPAERTKAESPFKSNLTTLREIEWLSMHIMSQVTSRLAGAGLMFVSQDIDFPPPPPINGVPQAYSNQATGLMLTLANTMEKAFKNPGSAEAHVPIILTVPGDQVTDSAKLLEFWSTLDDKARDMRNDSIRRFALGLEMPPEQLLGMGSNGGTGGGSSNGVSHWGAWQIEEQTIKMFIEPTLEIIVNTIGVAYLRPLMVDAAGVSILDGERVIADTANLRLRPDRSKEALELNARGLLTDVRTVEENGFDPKDMMSENDLKLWVLKKIASGSATPEQVAAAVQMLVGVPLPSGDQQVRESRPEPSLEQHPTRDIPEQAALLAAADSLTYRALERAGNKIRRQHGNPTVPGMTAYNVHTKFAANGSADKVLEDAWSCAPQVLSEIEGVDVRPTIARLDAYCRSLLTTQRPHTKKALAEFLELT